MPILVEHPGRHPQRRRKIADRKLAGFGIADAEIAWLDRAGGVSAMLRIELRVGFRRVDPVCKLGHGGSPAETLEAVANAPQPTRSRRRSPTHVVGCRLSRAIISQVIAPAASATAVGLVSKQASLVYW